MNKLQLNSCEYIDCNTLKKKRDDIINKYKNGEISFLVNVRILVEGFDAPITKGVCFLHLPTNKITLIQIIGRCLRLHPTKNIANIILPFSSKEDENNICNFLKVMAKNDNRIKKSFENKQLGGYISIDITEETDDEDINDNIEFKYNMVFDSMGILQNGEEIWMKRLEEVKKYIDDNNKRPSEESEIKTVKTLGKWVSHQIQNYKNKNGIMKKQIIYNIWTEFINNEKYKKYFMSNEEKWKIKFLLLIKYINTYTKKPKNNEIYEGIILSRWITAQQKNYLNKKKIMSNQTIYKIHGHILLMMININNILYLMMINGLFNSIN
jgi:superfamily II DNA/RNA helicase